MACSTLNRFFGHVLSKSIAFVFVILVGRLDTVGDIYQYNSKMVATAGGETQAAIANDARPTLSIEDASVTEGAAGQKTTLVFRLRLARPTSLPVTVNYSTVSGSGVSNSDFYPITDTLTFSPGSANETIPVTVRGDNEIEPDETFTLRLSNAQDADIGRAEAVGTILDDDSVAVRIGDASVTEPDSGEVPMMFTVSLAKMSAQTVTVRYATADLKANAGSDYVAANGLLTFPAGVTSQTLTVQIKSDVLDEPDETFAVDLINPVNATLADPRGIGTILDNDPPLLPTNKPPGVSITTPGTGTIFRFNTEIPIEAVANDTDGSITRVEFYADSKKVGESITPPYSVAWNGAPPGIHRLTAIATDNDGAIGVSAPMEIAVLSSSCTSAASIGGTDPPISSANISPPQIYFGEDVSPYPPFGVNQVARPGSIPKATRAAATFLARMPSVQTETFESFAPNAAPTHLRFGTNIVTLSGDQSIVEVSDPAGTINGEFPISGQRGLGLLGNSGTGFFSLDFSEPQAAFGFYATDIEFNGVNVTLIRADQSEQALTVPVTLPQGSGGALFWGVIDRENPFVRVELTRIGSSEDGFLFDDLVIATAAEVIEYVAWPAISLADALPIVEGNEGTKSAEFKVTLSQPITDTVTVEYFTLDSAARAGSDYVSTNGLITFPAGQTNATVVVRVIGDKFLEPDETFRVQLRNPSGAFFARCEAIGTISNDDSLPTLNIDDVSLVEGDSGTTPFIFTVSLSAPSEQEVSVIFVPTDGIALAPTDYQAMQGTLRFATGTGDPATSSGGNGSTPPSLSILRAGNGVMISWPGAVDGYTLEAADTPVGNGAWRVTTDTPQMIGNEHRVAAEATGAKRFYRLAPTLVFGGGETSKTITVLVNGDRINEPDETFFVNLSSAVNARIGKAQGIGKIVNDDRRINAPPTIAISSPANGTVFFRGAEILVTAEASDSDGTVSRVDFFSGTTLLGTATRSPYTLTWTGGAVDNYSLTAKATDDQGATAVSNPVAISIADIVADVAVVRNFADPEITRLEDYLFELGLSYHVFDQEGLTYEVLQNFKLIIWDDLGLAAGGLSDREVNLFQRAYHDAIPLYFIGESLASSTGNLSSAVSSQWTSLIHLQPATTKGGDHTVTLLTDPGHQVVNGQFGLAENFTYPGTLDLATETSTGEQLLATSGAAELLLAYQDPDTGVRTVTQNFLVANGSDAASLRERKRIFQNAVWWLLRKPLCGLADLGVQQAALPSPAAVGRELVYTLTVTRSGECAATGAIVTDTLPADVVFVSAETPLGTWSEANGIVTFRLGFLEEVSIPVKITVVPTRAGSLKNTADVRGNERDRSVGNNTSSLMITVEAP